MCIIFICRRVGIYYVIAPARNDDSLLLQRYCIDAVSVVFHINYVLFTSSIKHSKFLITRFLIKY